jgi:hypothetical protein
MSRALRKVFNAVGLLASQAYFRINAISHQRSAFGKKRQTKKDFPGCLSGFVYKPLSSAFRWQLLLMAKRSPPDSFQIAGNFYCP